MQPETTNRRPDTRQDAAAIAAAAQTRVDDVRERSRAASAAAEQATTEYVRRAHERVADVHATLAVSHEDHARALRLRGMGDRP